MGNRITEEFKNGIINGAEDAVEKFRCYLKENGTPIIDKIEGDDEHSSVTFVYEGEEELENVLIISQLFANSEGFEYKDYTLENIEGTNFWERTFKVKNDIKFTYIFFPNDSLEERDMERWGKRKFDHYARCKNFMKKDGERKIMNVGCIMPKAEESHWLKERSHGEKGTVYEIEFKEKAAGKSRIVRVYTPYGYKKDGEPYSFILGTDGDEQMNLLNSGTTLDNLIYEGKIPPVVGIFVDSSENRSQELRCNEEFCKWIMEEVFPWARENYNISHEPKRGVITGCSLGGLTASYIGLNYSYFIGNILSQSGSYWYKPEEYEEKGDKRWMIQLYEESEKLPLRFYLNYGTLESESMKMNVKAYGESLRNKGYEVKMDTFKSGHSSLGWADKFADGLISLIGE